MVLEGKTIVVTGATGLIGKNLVQELYKNGGHVIAAVRNLEKAKNLFPSDDNIELVKNDLASDEPFHINTPIDYIVHAGCPTSSEYMQSHPVETIHIILNGTRKVLELAREHSVQSIVFLSSVEIYGSITDDNVEITEDLHGYLNILKTRSSYPMGKQMAETLCYSYYKEYSIPVIIARLTQTFGPGVNIEEDNRVFAQFARSALLRENIVLHTEGRTKRMYLHISDAVSAILCLMENGKAGEAYNVANEDTYISIRDMAEIVKKHFIPNQQVIVKIQENTAYLPEIHLRLSTAKMRQLGWKPRYGLFDMYKSLITEPYRR